MNMPNSFKPSACEQGDFSAVERRRAVCPFNLRGGVFFLVLIVTALQGCIVIPVPEHGLTWGRGAITEADTALLELGKTTREEVLLRFGEPPAVLTCPGDPFGAWNHTQIFIYNWTVIQGYWMTIGAAGAEENQYLFLTEFDEHGRLRRFERKEIGWFTSLAGSVDWWTAPYITRLADITIACEQAEGTRMIPVVTLEPVRSLPQQQDSALAAAPSVRMKIVDFVNVRTGRDVGMIGHEPRVEHDWGYDLYLSRPLNDVVRDAVVAQWKAAGHRLVEDNPDVTLVGHVMVFTVDRLKNSFWGVDVEGTLDVTLKVHAKDRPAAPITRRYHAQHVETLRFTWSKKNFDKVVVSCLEDMMSQIAEDVGLARYLAGQPLEQSLP